MIPRSANRLEPVHPALEALDDGLLMIDDRWTVTYWNGAASRLVGVPRERVVGRDLWTALPVLKKSASFEAFRRVRRSGTPERYLDRFSDEGTGLTVSVHAAALPSGQLVVHFRDAAGEVQQAQRYAALLDSIQDGFIAVDADWRIVFMNKVAESVLRIGRRRWRKRGVPLWPLLERGPREVRESFVATMGDGVEGYVRGVRAPGPVADDRQYDLWSYPLEGGGISILFEDVSDRERGGAALTELAVEAREANLSKARFFAAVSHELRTPLNAIVGYTHLLAAETYGPLPEAASRAAGRAAMCAEHLAHLVDDLLLLTTTDIARLHLSVHGVDLGQLLGGAVGPYRHQAESKGLDFRLEPGGDTPIIESDGDRVRQVINSLLSNAIRYTSRGSIRVETWGEAGGAVISVSDTGRGISDEDARRIFDPFEQIGDPARSNPLTAGSGLGLTVASHLTRLLGGRLYLAESSAAGSSFRVWLPIRIPAFRVRRGAGRAQATRPAAAKAR